jgi:hypothetical protein
MANFQLNVSVLDGDGESSKMEFYLTAGTNAEAITNSRSMVEAMDNFILGKVNRVALSEVLDISSWSLKVAPDADADVEVKARFIFGVTGGFRTRISVPTYDKANYSNVGGSVDMGTTRGQWRDLILDNAFCDSRYANITSLLSAYEAFSGK